MDLIDNIRVAPARATYDATQVLHDRFSESESEAEPTQANVHEEASESDEEVGSFMDRFKMIKQRMKRTIVDDEDEEDDANESDTDQKGSEQPALSPVNKSVLLPQLEIDFSDIQDAAGTTQVGQPTQPVSQEHGKKRTVEERAAAILEQKRKNRELRQKRLEKSIFDETDEEEQEQEKAQEDQRQATKKQLEADISNVTLTDEENDELESAQTIAKPRKDDKEMEVFLSKQKRIDFFDNVAKPSAKVKKFSKTSFIDAFDDDIPVEAPKLAQEALEGDNDNNDQSEKEKEHEKEEDESDNEIRISSPITSPMRSPIKPQNPIETYKRKLQGVEIDLDDDDSEVPSLTKDKELVIKQKFIKKLPKKSKKKANKLLKHLFDMNINQINAIVRKHEDIEDDEGEEIMVNLLEKEIERTRNIRKMEKLREKAALALSKGEPFEAGDEAEDGEVADSDYWEHSDQEIEQDQNDSGSESNALEEGSDEDPDEDSDGNDHHIMIDNQADVTGNEPEYEDKENKNIEGESQLMTYEKNTSFSSQLFKNLKPVSETNDYVPPSQMKSFEMSEDEQKRADRVSQNDSVEKTEVDVASRGSTQVVRVTQVLQDTQVLQSNSSTQIIKSTDVEVETQADTSTQAILQSTQAENQSTQVIENEEVTPALVLQGREQIKTNQLLNIQEEEDEEADEELQERIKAYEEKIRRKELKLLQRRKEMERKGYKKIIEGEAEESEDEWAGIGGADGEHEDVANSEDERMIDNNLNIDLNNDEIRKKFMEQYQIKDRKELEKLLDDVKNHRLTKKVGVTLDLSEEEDELLLNYRRQKLQEQKLKLQQLDKSNKSEKAKAFFESIKEDLQNKVITIDDSEEEANEQEDEPSEDSAPKKFNEDFIRSKLSFLSESFDRYEYEQHKSRLQHDFDSEEEEDLNALKMKSFTNLKRSIREVEIETDDDQDHLDSLKETNAEDEENADDDDDLLPMRKPSMLKSFRSTSSTSSTFSGVTVSKQYKTAGGSKASITFMSKKPRVVQKRTLKHTLKH